MTPSPPHGYRLLRKGITIRKGDLQIAFGKPWSKVKLAIGSKVGWFPHGIYDAYARKQTTKGKKIK